MRPTRKKLLLFLFALGFLIAFVQIGLLSIAFYKLGLSPGAAYTLLIASLFGSVFNLPLFKMRSERDETIPSPPSLFPFIPAFQSSTHTLVAINVGGCLIPIVFSLYLLLHTEVTLAQTLLAIALVSLVSYSFSRPIQGLGIGMPLLIAPLAYIGGTMGVLIGADVLRINDIRRMGPPFAAIGGAGTFDGIFITGIVAVLLA